MGSYSGGRQSGSGSIPADFRKTDRTCGRAIGALDRAVFPGNFVKNSKGSYFRYPVACTCSGIQKEFAYIMAVSVVHWLTLAGCVQLSLWAFSLRLPLSAPFFVLVALVIGVAIPATPGAWGVVQACFVFALGPSVFPGYGIGRLAVLSPFSIHSGYLCRFDVHEPNGVSVGGTPSEGPLARNPHENFRHYELRSPGRVDFS